MPFPWIPSRNPWSRIDSRRAAQICSDLRQQSALSQVGRHGPTSRDSGLKLVAAALDLAGTSVPKRSQVHSFLKPKPPPGCGPPGRGPPSYQPYPLSEVVVVVEEAAEVEAVEPLQPVEEKSVGTRPLISTVTANLQISS
jgi:hypothetical protein